MTMTFARRSEESRLFGVQIAAGNVQRDDELLVGVDAAAASGMDLVVARVDVEDRERWQDVERRGGILCDTLVTYVRKTSARDASPYAPNAIRDALPSDAHALSAIAASSFSGYLGHWHTDPRIPRTLADRLYVQWTSDLLRRASDRSPLFVACDTDIDTAVAFLALALEDDDSRGSVPLTAVAPAARGRALLSQLLSHALIYLHRRGVHELEYETQVGNWAAQRTVSRAGFVPVRARHTFHLWLTDARAAESTAVPTSNLEIA